MAELERLAGEPVEMVIAGRTIRFSPFSIRMLSEFESWVNNERLKEALEALGNVSASERAAMIRDMIRERRGGMTDVVNEMTTVRGMMRLLWLAAKKNHPEIEWPEFETLAGEADYRELEAISDALYDSGGEEGGVLPPPRAAEEEAPG